MPHPPPTSGIQVSWECSFCGVFRKDSVYQTTVWVGSVSLHRDGKRVNVIRAHASID